MMAEPEPPAAPRGDRRRPSRIEQGEQAGHRDQQHRNAVERRQRRGGKRAQPEGRQISAETAQGGEELDRRRASMPARYTAAWARARSRPVGERKWHDHGPDMILRWQPSTPR